MNMKKFAIAAGLGLAALAGNALAADVKIAVLDAQQVVNDTNAAKKAIASLQSKREAAQKQIDGMEAPLLEKRKKLAGQQAVLSADKMKAEEEVFGKEVAQFREKAINIQRDLDEANLTARKKIADAVKAAVEAIAKEKGYDLVLPKNVILFNNASIEDISAEALKRANATLDK